MEKKWIPGINHIEFWVSDRKRSMDFYRPLFQLIGWREMANGTFSSGRIEIYFKEEKVKKTDSIGPRHICFQAVDRETVDNVARFLVEAKASIIRGPVERPEYSPGYYTVDFRDPDSYVIEVAYTPNMEL